LKFKEVESMHPLERARRAAGYSQRELAELAEVPRKSIQFIETGRTRTPHPSTLRKLAGVLECLPGSLNPALEPEEGVAVG
jgi:transcriptional regulator with XRE-family HTH domain